MAVYDAFKRHITDNNIVDIAFLDSTKITPLQAADLFAWEFNRIAQNILEKGANTLTTQEMLHLAKGMKWLDGQYAKRDRIIQLSDRALAEHAPDVLAILGDYFEEFGREEIARAKVSKKAKKKPPS